MILLNYRDKVLVNFLIICVWTITARLINPSLIELTVLFVVCKKTREKFPGVSASSSCSNKKREDLHDSWVYIIVNFRVSKIN